MTTEKDNTELIKEFLKEFETARFNAVYFLEKYWNKSNPDKQIHATEDDKQLLYDKFKGAPFFSDLDAIVKYTDRVDALKAEGLKDWEIDLKIRKGM